MYHIRFLIFFNFKYICMFLLSSSASSVILPGNLFKIFNRCSKYSIFLNYFILLIKIYIIGPIKKNKLCNLGFKC